MESPYQWCDDILNQAINDLRAVIIYKILNIEKRKVYWTVNDCKSSAEYEDRSNLICSKLFEEINNRLYQYSGGEKLQHIKYILSNDIFKDALVIKRFTDPYKEGLYKRMGGVQTYLFTNFEIENLGTIDGDINPEYSTVDTIAWVSKSPSEKHGKARPELKVMDFVVEEAKILYEYLQKIKSSLEYYFNSLNIDIHGNSTSINKRKDPKTGPKIKKEWHSFNLKGRQVKTQAISELRTSLINLELISNEQCSLINFRKLFQNEKLDCKIKWLGTISDLYTFVKYIHLRIEVIDKIQPGIWVVTSKCFMDKNGEPFDETDFQRLKVTVLEEKITKAADVLKNSSVKAKPIL